MTTRTTLALPIDVALTFDSTVTQTQLQNNTFQGSADDRDVLKSDIVDAEDELRARADLTTRLSRQGSPGDTTTYEELTYDLPGHENYKAKWSQVGGDYLNEDVTKDLSQDHLLPFDADAGDEAYIYRGLGTDQYTDGWEEVTDERGDTWDILDYRSGTVIISAVEIDRAMAGHTAQGLGTGQQSKFRMKLTYRYGAQGGDRAATGTTDLDASISDSDTVPLTVTVADASRLPTTGGGSVEVLINEEYVSATVDPAADELTIVERGIRGTTTADHDSGDRVQYTPPAIRKAVAARTAMQVIESGRYQSFLPDSEDAIGKDDMMDSFGETWQTTLEALS